ncbi:MAG: metallophosphoesterase [Bacteroidales bacterium]
MNIIVTSDLHGHLPKVPPCDMLLLVGDIFPGEMDHNCVAQGQWYDEVFEPWVEACPCKKVVMTFGNHDYFFEGLYDGVNDPTPNLEEKEIHLLNCGAEIMGLKIYGTPNVPPPFHNMCFAENPESLAEIFAGIPDDLDILLVHAAPILEGLGMGSDGVELGCQVLTDALSYKHIKYVFCGHIHTGNHKKVEWLGKTLYNVSYCDNDKNPQFDLLKIII